MSQNAVQILKENYNRLGDLTDAEFIATKAKVCAKRIIHVERIIDIRRADGFSEEKISLGQIQVGDTIKINATVRNMLGGQEKSGVVTMPNIQDIYFEEALGMLVIESAKHILTTMECKSEMLVLDAVIRDDNWVNVQSLGEIIGEDTLLTEFQYERDNELHLDLGEVDREKDGLEDLFLDEPDLLF